MHEFFHSRLLAEFEAYLVGLGLRGFALERWLFAAHAAGDYESLCSVVASYGRCGSGVDRVMLLGPSNEFVRGYFLSGGV